MIQVLLPFQNPIDFGAAGDGKTLDTAAMQAAIDACAGKGGTVWVPAGKYLIGSLFLKNNLSLYLDAGATLLGSQSPEDYPLIESRWEGAQQRTHAPLIGGQNLENVAITGRGVIDGCGESWWRAYAAKTLTYPRPRLIAFADCRNLLIEGITAVNSPGRSIRCAART
jgi:polygalacturonase